MSLRTPLLLTVAIALFNLSTPVPAGATPTLPRPALSESLEALAQPLSCPVTFSRKHEPVLLVHAATERCLPGPADVLVEQAPRPRAAGVPARSARILSLADDVIDDIKGVLRKLRDGPKASAGLWGPAPTVG